jgi:UDP-N-acetylmuramoyl-L-alanyl-D-glutamate--2,6-diaminopimelate ligase
MEHYRDSKSKLFEALSADAFAVLNVRDEASAVYAERTSATVIWYGLEQAVPDGRSVHGVIQDMDWTGLTLNVTIDGQSVSVKSPMVGRHNAENLLAAAGVGSALGMTPEVIGHGLASLRAVPGRLEPIVAGQPFGVYVDYAHTEDALRNVLQAVRPLATNRVLVVFGCGGDRDRAKRAPMGRAAYDLADVVFVTSDNPRNEEPGRILSDVLEGIPEPVYADPDRPKAIRAAVAQAVAGDVVVIAGKGHEDYQIVQGTKHHMDDREEAHAALAEIGYSTR